MHGHLKVKIMLEVGIVTGLDWTTKVLWFNFWHGHETFFFCKVSRPAVRCIQPCKQ